MQRRQFLKYSSLVSLSPTLPTFLSRSAIASSEAKKSNGRVLVVIQLDGGNDGINTVVPFQDEGYAKNRRELRLPDKQLIKVANDFAFHPRLRSVSELFDEKRLSVVHGVGYPNPNRSHFESMAIWHAGSTDEELRHLGNGWIGDAMSHGRLTSGPHAIHVGHEALPVALRGRRCSAPSVANAADLQLRLELSSNKMQTAKVDGLDSPADTPSLNDFLTKSVSEAYASAKELSEATKRDQSAKYPNSRLGERLRMVSQMIKSDAKARVYYTQQDGYDTHAAQMSSHGNLLGELSGSLKAFMDDLKQSGLEDQVLVMAFSEFGRRVAENDSFGTDHGTAGPVLLAGSGLGQRTYGRLPSLTDLEGGDVKFNVDFRDIYASILAKWLEIDCPSVLDGHDHDFLRFRAIMA